MNSLLITGADGGKLGDVSDSKDRKTKKTWNVFSLFSFFFVGRSLETQHDINDRKITTATGSLEGRVCDILWGSKKSGSGSRMVEKLLEKVTHEAIA